MTDADLTALFRDWPFEPGRLTTRLIDGTDGRQKLQVRIDLGVLQMELDGRPDGQRPEDADTLLAHQGDRLARYQAQNASPEGFVLSPEECRALREEAVQFYHRYVALFSLGEFDRVVRDTAHNLAIFDLMHRHGAEEHDRMAMEQFRPPVIAMGIRARAEAAIAAGNPKDALSVLDEGLVALSELFNDLGDPDAFDHANETQLLRGMRDALVPKLPASERAELSERLQAALDAENYELAAILRDELRMLPD